MKLEYVEGCTCTSLKVDDTETMNLDIKEFQKVIISLFDRETNRDVLENYFRNILTEVGEYKDLTYGDNYSEMITVNKFMFKPRKDKYDFYGEQSFVYIDTVFTDIFIVDGREWDFNITEPLRERFHNLIMRITDVATLQTLFMDSIKSQGTYEDLGHCDCCGDYIYKYTLEI